MKVTRGKVMKQIGCTGFALIVIIALAVISTVIQYREENTVTATVTSITTQQNVNGGGSVTTTYTYRARIRNKGVKEMEDE